MSTQSSTYPTDSLLAFEIAQQPVLWPLTVDCVQAAPPEADFSRSPVILTGAGTSAYAASAIAEAWPQAIAMPTTDLLIQSVEEIEAAIPSFRHGGLLVSLARSGDSPESIGVVAKIQKLFPAVKHLAIVCNASGRLARAPGVQKILLDARTNDRSLAMTGSFSNLVLAGLALKHREKLARSLPDICQRVQTSLPDFNGLIQEIARSCKDRVVILTSSMQALAKEAALKIVELTDGCVVAMPETFLGFRHGAVGFLREDTPVICFLSSDPQKRLYEHDLLDDLRGKGLGRLVIVGDDPLIAQSRDWFLPANAPALDDSLRTPFEIPFAQLLAYHLSVNSHVDPDNPSPNGTITRVVRPFRIHDELARA